MAIDKVKAFLRERGMEERVLEFETSSATVELAAQAVGCEPARIAKTLSFHVGDRVALVVAAGDARIDNPKYKARFGCKAKMLAADEAEPLIGHGVGGVCPFALNEGVDVFLDESLRRFDTVYPAAGNAASAVRLAPDELERRLMEAGERRSGEMTFYVVRHGQTLFNVMGKVQGWCDTPLTDEGVRAAQSLGRGLAEVDFSAAYSSDSGRAVHTLDELLRARGSGVPFGPYDDMRLREWCYGDLEGEPGELLHATLDAGFGAPLSFEEHNRRLPEVADVLADADCSGRAERFDAIERRLRGFFREAGDDGLKRGGGNVLVVTHSFVVRTLVYLIDPERVNDPVKIPNASVTRISYDGSDFRLGEIGSTAWQRP